MFNIKCIGAVIKSSRIFGLGRFPVSFMDRQSAESQQKREAGHNVRQAAEQQEVNKERARQRALERRRNENSQQRALRRVKTLIEPVKSVNLREGKGWLMICSCYRCKRPLHQLCRQKTC